MIITVDRYCPICGKVSLIPCEESAWFAYEDGALAQDAFADMDIYTRETIISGMCSTCQNLFFVEDEDECDGDCEECEAWAECPDRHKS